MRNILIFALILFFELTVADVYNDAVGYWRFDNTDSELLLDSSGNNNHLYLGSEIDVDSKEARMVDNGVSNKAIYGIWGECMASSVHNNDYLNFQPYEPFSIALWVKNQSRGRNSFIVSKMESSGNYRGYALIWSAQDKLEFLVRSENTIGKRLWVKLDMPISQLVDIDDQWVHLAVTYNGNMSISGVKFHINGMQIDSILLTEEDNESGLIATNTTVNNAPFVLGGRDKSCVFGGYLDEAALWDKALSNEEVKSAMQQTIPVAVSYEQSDLVVSREKNGSLDISLTSAPQTVVIIKVSTDNPNIDLGRGADVPVSLSFTADNWNISKSVSISVIENQAPKASIIRFNTISADSAFDDRYVPPIKVIAVSGKYGYQLNSADLNKDFRVSNDDYSIFFKNWLAQNKNGDDKSQKVTYSGHSREFIASLRPGKREITIPTLDISGETWRHTIIAQGTSENSQNHSNTEMMNDGTIFIVWTDGHGGPVRYLKKSTDGGLTWSELLDIPDNWQEHANCPAFYRLKSREGNDMVFLYASLGPQGQLMYYSLTDDEGKNWSDFKPVSRNDSVQNLTAGMPFTAIMDVNDGKELIGFTNIRRPKEGYPSTIIVQSHSYDGGFTWSKWDIVLDLGNPFRPCEPDIIRSPDGKQLLMIARENERSFNSWIMLSDDEGKSWSDPFQATASVSMDRHQHKYLPDGRLIILGRDTANESLTRSHFVAWIGTYDDLINGGEGKYRVKLLHHYGSGSVEYPSIELLDDGTILAFNALSYKTGEAKSIVSTRFTVEQLDEKFSNYND